ncbi:hypothetical protein [Endozoicomonas numazuensis]|nr:hypothetical protein [Endozoicomonas numazuensis]
MASVKQLLLSLDNLEDEQETGDPIEPLFIEKKHLLFIFDGAGTGQE